MTPDAGDDLVWRHHRLNLQPRSSPPFGFALFYLRSVAAKRTRTRDRDGPEHGHHHQRDLAPSPSFCLQLIGVVASTVHRHQTGGIVKEKSLSNRNRADILHAGTRACSCRSEMPGGEAAPAENDAKRHAINPMKMQALREAPSRPGDFHGELGGQRCWLN
jgi:hypothetical protein